MKREIEEVHPTDTPETMDGPAKRGRGQSPIPPTAVAGAIPGIGREVQAALVPPIAATPANPRHIFSGLTLVFVEFTWKVDHLVRARWAAEARGATTLTHSDRPEHLLIVPSPGDERSPGLGARLHYGFHFHSSGLQHTGLEHHSSRWFNECCRAGSLMPMFPVMDHSAEPETNDTNKHMPKLPFPIGGNNFNRIRFILQLLDKHPAITSLSRFCDIAVLAENKRLPPYYYTAFQKTQRFMIYYTALFWHIHPAFEGDGSASTSEPPVNKDVELLAVVHRLPVARQMQNILYPWGAGAGIYVPVESTEAASTVPIRLASDVPTFAEPAVVHHRGAAILPSASSVTIVSGGQAPRYDCAEGSQFGFAEVMDRIRVALDNRLILPTNLSRYLDALGRWTCCNTVTTERSVHLVDSLVLQRLISDGFRKEDGLIIGLTRESKEFKLGLPIVIVPIVKESQVYLLAANMQGQFATVYYAYTCEPLDGTTTIWFHEVCRQLMTAVIGRVGGKDFTPAAEWLQFQPLTLTVGVMAWDEQLLDLVKLLLIIKHNRGVHFDGRFNTSYILRTHHVDITLRKKHIGDVMDAIKCQIGNCCISVPHFVASASPK